MTVTRHVRHVSSGGSEKRLTAFTLVELLAVLAVVVVLIALTMPVLQQAKAAVNHTANLAAMRQFSTALTLYSLQSDGSFPFFGIPGAPERGLSFGTCRVGVFSSQGAQVLVDSSQYWVSAIVPFLSGWNDLPYESRIDRDGVVMSSCGSSGKGMYWSPVRMTHTVFADPAFFTDAGPHSGSMINGSRISQVRHPSRKGMLIGFPSSSGRVDAGTFPPAFVRIAFADGSTLMQPWVIRAIDPPRRPPFTLIDYWPIMATPDGLKGFDY